MDRLWTVADVCRRLCWDPRDAALYRRVYMAVATGPAGQVPRCGRAFILTEAKVRKVVRYLREHWPEGTQHRPYNRKRPAATATGAG
jgi:hypothetical protein